MFKVPSFYDTWSVCLSVCNTRTYRFPELLAIIIIIITSQGGKVTILWNQQVQTDRTIPNNKLDIIIRDNEKGTCMLIDVAISGDRNVIKKEAEKISKI